MKTVNKLMQAFEKFRPHINGHKTAMELFFEAVREVEELEKKVNNLDIPVVRASTLDVPDIRNRLSPIVHLVSMVEDSENTFIDEIIPQVKENVNYLAQRKVYSP